MDIGELFHSLKAGSLVDLFPVSKITDDNIDELRAIGYAAAITGEAYAKKFPWLPIEKAFMSLNIASSLIYYDAAKYICCDLCIYGDQYLGLMGDTLGTPILKRIALCEEAYAKKKYSDLLMVCPIDGYRIELLGKILRENPDADLYEVFRDFYTMSDYGFGNLTSEDVVAVYQKAPAKHFEQIKQQFDGQNKITIYRGQGEKSTAVSKALSWTTQLSTAYFFAVRFASEVATIHTAEADVEDILDTFPNQAEGEVLVKPGRVKMLSTNYLPGMHTIRSLSVKEEYFDKAKELYGNTSGKHGYSHICRMLVMLKVVTPVLKLSSQEIKILHTAILYHDLGRSEDGEDEEHGAISAKLFVSDNPKIRNQHIIEAIVRLHSVDDMKALEELKVMRDSELAIRMYKTLKDIDALDRVRFGLNDLDINYLRHPHMKNYVLIANLLQKFQY